MFAYINSHVFVNLKYEDGVASVESSTMLPSKFPFNIGFNIICESGTITFDGKSSSVISIDEAIKSLKIVLGIKKSLNNNCIVSLKDKKQN